MFNVVLVSNMYNIGKKTVETEIATWEPWLYFEVLEWPSNLHTENSETWDWILSVLFANIAPHKGDAQKQFPNHDDPQKSSKFFRGNLASRSCFFCLPQKLSNTPVQAFKTFHQGSLNLPKILHTFRQSSRSFSSKVFRIVQRSHSNFSQYRLNFPWKSFELSTVVL